MEVLNYKTKHNEINNNIIKWRHWMLGGKKNSSKQVIKNWTSFKPAGAGVYLYITNIQYGNIKIRCSHMSKCTIVVFIN